MFHMKTTIHQIESTYFVLHFASTPQLSPVSLFTLLWFLCKNLFSVFLYFMQMQALVPPTIHTFHPVSVCLPKSTKSPSNTTITSPFFRFVEFPWFFFNVIYLLLLLSTIVIFIYRIISINFVFVKLNLCMRK